MIKITVTGSQWIDGSGWDYTEDLDPLVIETMDDLKEAAQLYAAEFAKGYTSSAGSDYELRFYSPEDEYLDSPLCKVWLSDAIPMAERCLKALREYDGGNEWGDIISGSDEWPLDEAAMQEADPAGESDIAIFTDGSRIAWHAIKHEWVVMP